jgi:serine protease Do
MNIMQFRWAALWAMIGVFAGGAGTEVRGQYSRQSPIVKAVQKTRDAIVSIKAEKRRGRSGKEVVGTGVIVDERGYVLTNHHVAAASDSVTVQLADGSEYSVESVADVSSRDLAIFRITGRDEQAPLLKALPLGPGNDLLVGETVIAIGHPFGYQNTVTTGIVSALGREITMPDGEVLSDLIQTSASINPGNSGGPLLNINGELIGINVALRDGAQGIAFALNAETVKDVLSQHLSSLRLSGVTHGLRCREAVQPEGLDRQHVVVEAVIAEMPAAAAGLARGDEILAVARQTVSNRFDVERAIWGYRPGEKVDLKVRRGGKEMTLALKLAAGSKSANVASKRGPRAADTNTRATGSGEDDSH